MVTDQLRTQEVAHSDLTTWLNIAANVELAGKDQPVQPGPHFFPAWDVLPHEQKLPHADIISERLATLAALIQLQAGPATDSGLPIRPVVASVSALIQRTFPAAELRRRTRTLPRGVSCNPLDLIEWLEEQGYEPETQVTHKGELSWRGGIVDIWPLSSPWPVRLEFFGDELESLREFDPQRQVSREQIELVTIPPAGELSLLQTRPAKWESNSDSGSATVIAPPPALGTILDYLPDHAVLILSEPAALREHAERQASQSPAGDPFVISWAELLAEADRRGMTRVELVETELPNEDADFDVVPIEVPTLRVETLDAYRPIGSALPAPVIAETQRREFFQQMHRWLRQGLAVQVFCNTQGERQRFGELWQEYRLAAPNEATNGGTGMTQPLIHLGSLSRGFLVPDAKLVIVTDAEIYGRYKVARPRRLKSPHAQAMRSAFEVDFTEFEEGDYVVHLQHGIGLFRGLKTLLPPKVRERGAESPGATAPAGQECLVIEYAARESGVEAPKLYVPVTEAHLVSKYVGAGKARPQLSTLGGARWTKAKEEAQESVRDLAGDLLRVQAARATLTGHSCAPDNNWQREFEAAFEFEETPDQIAAIAATKRDLEASKPMDRLLCGDVGFGKTEVAIRAAFKAVMSGKQVAILVPTTVLAQQHYNSFRERMAEFPVRVELLSRFRTTKQQQAVLQAAAAGAVDIVIGTHRLVSPDVQFKELGLVIVDEEQKFGVKHKEQFKLLRTTVDVLTLSATPIPRTLHLALTGARDLSTLETPPQDRLPVETIVGNYDERVIRDAIQRELNRGGQVYFLHNRVSTIEAVAIRLKALLPDARIVIGHGQMESDSLEMVMTQFVNGEADVLVSTTIIESGLDIPNANTIIIDRADRFGLSELYQLRGRVGRYKHQAYCYLMLPRHAQLLTEARKRMSAIKQYSALGSGFKIALRDLEIRGAGNILGAQQSGHITAVGFDLYCQLLKQSIAALKGDPVRPRLEVRMNLDFLAANPGEEGAATPRRTPSRSKAPVPQLEIEVPREGIARVFEDDASSEDSRIAAPAPEPPKTPAYLPLDYLRESTQRIEIYRKLAQALVPADLAALRVELRDRFGPPPPPVELLIGVHELRLIAAAKNVTSVEVVEGKVKLTRNRDLITVGGQFPRLGKREAKARLSELRGLLLSLG
ncbi:MAG TPA: transcription-repair coupling factor [Verrucomicrobiales bacterium]|nr:transcription-repair coupling factor [Verrucomicrobiales bacterium]